jgi:hypothetical protein
MCKNITLKLNRNRFSTFTILFALLLICTNHDLAGRQKKPEKNSGNPRIVNIINFIRLLEPRDKKITEEVLYETVVSQVKIMNKYSLRGTFLLQYDALMDPRYQKLMKSLPADSFEIGGWWEIPQPLVEKSGFKWRGRYPWDWHADVGFSTGYLPAEREKLVDIYMNDFKLIFGYYPKSVGSWFIDEHTLNYMYEKYGIKASCNCKDQVGTDGYTLWGGYWNQAYYPSKVNSYMPAQNENKQIPVPVFRMLGSDPLRQYDAGLGTKVQGVVSMEPVYRFGGGDSTWVKWYFDEFVERECMEYAYVQVGQENSFTWEKMAKGFEIQMPLVARLRDERRIQVETLAESGEWFRSHFKTTPATSVTVMNGTQGDNRKTVWFNSRFYRVNLLWENNNLRFRDIHIFNEDLPSDYLTERVNSNQCSFYTLPFVDGYIWSSKETTAGLRFKALVNGKEINLEGDTPVVRQSAKGKLHIEWPLKSFDAKMIIEMDEKNLVIKTEGKDQVPWFLDLTTGSNAELPFTKIGHDRVDSRFKEINYPVSALNGSFSEPGKGVIFRLAPDKNILGLDFTKK